MNATMTQPPAARRGFLRAAGTGNNAASFKKPAYPCPFCRSAMTWRESYLLRRQVYLGCENCGAKSPRGDTKQKVLFQFDIPLIAAAPQLLFEVRKWRGYMVERVKMLLGTSKENAAYHQKVVDRIDTVIKQTEVVV